MSHEFQLDELCAAWVQKYRTRKDASVHLLLFLNMLMWAHPCDFVPPTCPCYVSLSAHNTRFLSLQLVLQHVPSCFTTLNFQSRWVHPWHCSPNPGGGKKTSVPWERGGGWDCQVLHWAQPLRGGNYELVSSMDTRCATLLHTIQPRLQGLLSVQNGGDRKP